MIIEESRSANLYHATSLASACNIIKSNELSKGRNPQYDFRSFSRSLTNSTLRGANNYGRVVFVIDQLRLSNNHKIIPRGDMYRGHNSKFNRSRYPEDNKAEEVVPGAIKNFLSYVKEIILLGTDGDYPDDFIKLLNSKNIKYSYVVQKDLRGKRK